MYRFTKCFTLALILTVSAGLRVAAQERVTPTDLNLHREVLAVSLNGIDVSDGSQVYLDDDGTVYVSKHDLAEWGLKYPITPAVPQIGEYYTLQSQLNLAVSVDHAQERLEIIAPPTALIGGPDRMAQSVTPGRGGFLNYRFDYQNATGASPATTLGNYNLFYTQNAATLQMEYQSEQSSAAFSAFRTLTRIYKLDVPGHRVFQVGEGSVRAGEVGTAAQYLGLHVSSNYAGDPLFMTHSLPKVTGVANGPSLVEVYVNNVLVWRDEVLEGPFTVGNLPASAAYSDITLVLTDRFGHKTIEIVRPQVDQEFLRPGLISYSVDVGAQRARALTSKSARYGDLLGSAMMRYGLTSWLTLQGMGESVEGKPFEALGFQARPGQGQQIVFWFGDGRIRRTGSLLYELRAGKFTFRDRLKYNAESRPYAFENGVDEQFEEQVQLAFSPSSDLALSLQLNRTANNSGFVTSLTTFESRFSRRSFELILRPSYDHVNHAFGGMFEITKRLGEIHSLRGTVNQYPNATATSAFTYEKMQRDPDDPWTWRLQDSQGTASMHELTVEDRFSWSDSRLIARKVNGVGTIRGELSGSVAAVGLGLNAIRNVQQEEVLGVVRLPRFAGVAIKLNGSPAGYTDRDGNLILRRLSSLQENFVLADLSTLPLAVAVRDPVRVVPLPSTPVSIDMLYPQAQSAYLRVLDVNGNPLPAASWLVADDGTRFPIGYDGRTYIRGLAPGLHSFAASGGFTACSLKLTLAPRWEIVDEGTLQCK